MRKIVLIALFASVAASLFAFTDSFASTGNDPLFISLITAIKNTEDEETVTALYDAYIASDITMTEKTRIEYHMARYFMDMGNKKEAERHVELGKNFLEKIGKEEGELSKRIAQADIVSADYYVNGGMGKGLENSKLTKALYSDYPDEYYVALQEAFRLLYTPAIAGGSAKKALTLFNQIENEIEGLSLLDRFSLFSGKGIALSQREEYDESDCYLDKAEEIFTGDPAIADARNDNIKARRNNGNR